MEHIARHLCEILDLSLPLLRDINGDTASVKPAPEKWSYKEIIGHLTDSAANNHQKFIRTMATDGVQFPPYEQNYWVAAQHYNEYSWQDLLQLWEQYNRHLAHVMKFIPGEKLPNKLFIADKGPYTLEFIVTDYVEHLKHHLKAILPEAEFLKNSFRMIY
jgi:hypothetical protein